MSKQICDFNCLHCKYEDCINDSDDLSEDEVSFSAEYETSIKHERRQEVIRHIDDPKARAIARYRQTDKGKAMLHKMNTSPKAKERFKRYEQSEKAKERRKRHEAKPERIAYRKNYMETYNKEYQSVVRDRKEAKRMEEARSHLDILLEKGEVSVCDGHRNRPREKQKYERILKVISERNISIQVHLDVESGLVTKGEVNADNKNQ